MQPPEMLAMKQLEDENAKQKKIVADLWRDFDLWAYVKGVSLDFSRPVKPNDNAFIEAFNGASGGVPQRALVPDACPRPRKVGGLAQGLQRGSATRAIGNKRPAPAGASSPPTG